MGEFVFDTYLNLQSESFLAPQTRSRYPIDILRCSVSVTGTEHRTPQILTQPPGTRIVFYYGSQTAHYDEIRRF